MTQMFNKTLAIMVMLFAAVSALSQTDQAAKQPALDQRVRAEVSQFKGKVSLYAKNLDTGASYELGGDDRVPLSDPTIDADWGLADPILSARDESNPSRADLPPGRRPYFPMRG